MDKYLVHVPNKTSAQVKTASESNTNKIYFNETTQEIWQGGKRFGLGIANIISNIGFSNNKLTYKSDGVDGSLTIGYATNADKLDGYHYSSLYNRNYFPGTKGSWKAYTINKGAYTVLYSISMEYFTNLGIKAGDQMILSLTFKGNTTGRRMRARLQFFNSSSDRTGPTSATESSTTDVISSASFTWLENYSKVEILVDTNLDSSAGPSTEYIKDIKLERNAIATQWIPAFEDFLLVDDTAVDSDKLGGNAPSYYLNYANFSGNLWETVSS